MRALSVITLLAALVLPTVVFAEIQTFTTTHSYVLGDDDSRNSARQKCLAEAKRKILEQVGVYLESKSELITSSQSSTSGGAKSPQSTNEERQQITEQINTVTAGVMRTEVVKEEFGEANGRLQITLTLKSEVDPDDIRKQLAARQVDAGVRDSVAAQQEHLKRLEAQLEAMLRQMQQSPGRTPVPPTSDIPTAYLQAMRTHAAQGNAVAQNNLGMLYYWGRGVPQDYDQARYWFEKAVAQGNANAQFTLGRMYAEGYGVSQDYATARRWYEKAAAQGDAGAQLHLGMLYLIGKGAHKDYVQAAKWLEKSATQGIADAQLALGMIYFDIEGLLNDNTKAAKWFEEAAAQGEVEAQNLLGYMYARGEGVPQDYAQAAKWYKKAALQGHAEAQLGLGIMYLYGRGVPQDDATARRWYENAAAQGNTEAQGRLRKLIDVQPLRTRATQGHADAQLQLGVLYDHGEGVPQDYTQARKWWEKAAAQGNAEAQVRLGKLYRDGHGVTTNYTQMWKWYEKAADQGNADAQVEIGGRYLSGDGVVPQDYALSIKWYEKAATQGNAGAQSMLGILYARGQGVPQDDMRAYMWHHLAGTNLVGFQDEDEDRFRREVRFMRIKHRDEVARRMTPAQIVEAQRLAQECQARQFKGC